MPVNLLLTAGFSRPSPPAPPPLGAEGRDEGAGEASREEEEERLDSPESPVTTGRILEEKKKYLRGNRSERIVQITLT